MDVNMSGVCGTTKECPSLVFPMVGFALEEEPLVGVEGDLRCTVSAESGVEGFLISAAAAAGEPWTVADDSVVTGVGLWRRLLLLLLSSGLTPAGMVGGIADGGCGGGNDDDDDDDSIAAKERRLFRLVQQERAVEVVRRKA